MPELITRMARCSGVQSFCSTMAGDRCRGRRGSRGRSPGIVERGGDQGRRRVGFAGARAAARASRRRAGAYRRRAPSAGPCWHRAQLLARQHSARGRCPSAAPAARIGRLGLEHASTSSAWCPVTTTMRSGEASARGRATTCSTSAMPPARCSTFARFERMRVPSPAARITT